MTKVANRELRDDPALPQMTDSSYSSLQKDALIVETSLIQKVKISSITLSIDKFSLPVGRICYRKKPTLHLRVQGVPHTLDFEHRSLSSTNVLIQH